jgi:hypothetical protein
MAFESAGDDQDPSGSVSASDNAPARMEVEAQASHTDSED